uniref:hypothetical protein n=1 Tax=Arthrobacter ramosus TaxID=1672 RepID=UPI001F2FDD00|nr:hypothetical protein [Arthrobacter ramosus]
MKAYQRGYFPNDAAALKCLYLVTWSLTHRAGLGTMAYEVEVRSRAESTNHKPRQTHR